MMPMKLHTEQLGGHNGNLYIIKGGKVMKKSKPTEYKFYISLKQRSLPEHIIPFFPKFYGVHKHDGVNYVLLEDIVHNYETPSIIDIKIGTSSVDPREDDAKKEYMRSRDNDTTTKLLGLRVCGFKVWDVSTNQYIKEGKEYGRKLKPFGMIQTIKKFFCNGIQLRKDIIQYLLKRLYILKEWWEDGGDFSLISSSLLIVYESNVNHVKADVRMIDFAHASDLPKGERDENYITGLTNLIKILESIYNEEELSLFEL